MEINHDTCAPDNGERGSDGRQPWECGEKYSKGMMTHIGSTRRHEVTVAFTRGGGVFPAGNRVVPFKVVVVSPLPSIDRPRYRHWEQRSVRAVSGERSADGTVIVRVPSRVDASRSARSCVSIVFPRSYRRRRRHRRFHVCVCVYSDQTRS